MLYDEELSVKFGMATDINCDNLMTILKDNKDTAFGKKYSFSKIESIDEYRRRLPLMKYPDIEKYIGMMRDGRNMQLTAYNVIGYCHTSGTTGEPKYIPVTDHEMMKYSDFFERFQDSTAVKHGGKKLFLNTFRVYPHRDEPVPELFSEICYKNLAERNLINYDLYAGGKDFLFDAGSGDIFFAKAWLGIAEEKIAVIESIYLYDQLCFFSYLEENHEKIIRSIREKKIPEDISLSENIKSKLLAMYVSEERLSKAEQEFAESFDNIALRLWKGLVLISGISNKAYYSEDETLRRYVGDVKRYYFCYCASECCFGFPEDADSFEYVLFPDNAFFEFVPYDENGAASETMLPHELEIGRYYEPVVTNYAGLYRFMTGDVIKVTGFYKQSPVMEFAFRKSLAFNIAGEKMTLRQIEAAVNSLSEFNIYPEKYCFGIYADKMPGMYILFTVLSDYGCIVDSEQLSDMMDYILKDLNHDYEDLRNIGGIKKLKAVIMDNSEYSLITEKYGMTGGHNKPKHIIPGIIRERGSFL